MSTIWAPEHTSPDQSQPKLPKNWDHTYMDRISEICGVVLNENFTTDRMWKTFFAFHERRYKTTSMILVKDTFNKCFPSVNFDDIVTTSVSIDSFRMCARILHFQCFLKWNLVLKTSGQKLFNGEKKDSKRSQIRTKKGPVIELLRTFSRYFCNNAKKS